MNKHQAMIDYMKQFPPIASQWLYFDYLRNDEENQGLAPVSKESGGIRYDIMGNKIGQYDFALLLTRNMSTSTDDTNVQNMLFIDDWIDWIGQRNYNRILPDFGEGTEVESIEPLSNMGNLSQVFDNGTGKYIVLCRVKYTEWRYT